MRKLSWRPFISKFIEALNPWRSKAISLFGKIVVLNASAYSQLVYPLQVLPLSKQTASTIDKETRKFLWNGRAALVSLDKLCANRKNGGLGLFDLQRCKNKMRWKLKNITPNIEEHPCNLTRLVQGNKKGKRYKIDPLWKEISQASHPEVFTQAIVSPKWKLTNEKHGKALFKVHPKHAATLFKFAFSSLPMADRFHSPLPMPPCPMCKNGPDDHDHLLSCRKTEQAWEITQSHCGLQLGDLKDGLVEAWSQNKISPRAHYAAATLHGLWWYRCSTFFESLNLHEAILLNIKKLIL